MRPSARTKRKPVRGLVHLSALVFLSAVAFAPVAWERLPWAGLVIVPPDVPGGAEPEDPGVDETTYSDVGVIAPEDPYPTSNGSNYKYFDSFGTRPPVVSTCDPLPFTIRSNAGPKGGVELIFEAMQRLANATGVSFVFEGFTDKVYNFAEPSTVWPWDASDRHVWIGWASEGEVPDLGPKDEDGSYIVGLGGPHAIEVDDGYEIIRGAVVLRVDYDAEAVFGTGHTWGNVLQHELGHAFGLDHIDEETQLMYPNLLPDHGDGWQDGDLAGLQGINERCAR